MKQILLRVPDEVHRRLTTRASRDGRSVNALACELIDLGVDADEGGRRARLRARAAALGIAPQSHSKPEPKPEPIDRERTLGDMGGWGPEADTQIAFERDRV